MKKQQAVDKHTKLVTKSGVKQVKDIEKSDKVLTTSGYAKILAIIKPKPKHKIKGVSLKTLKKMKKQGFVYDYKLERWKKKM